MDISKINDEIAQDEVAVPVTVMRKNGEPYLASDGTPVTIDVLGVDAKAVVAAKDAQMRKLSRKRKTTWEPAEYRANRIETAAAAIASWTGWEMDGAPWPYTRANAIQLLAAEHILIQVEEGMTQVRDFSSTSSTTSSPS